ncbi:MAG: GNAT family N-acetyltransferase [Brevundimonas sp.]|uniref:GNAT family N-acetyltransferase n=1 Tax=Brevundimonas sp. TaxID=1871086 RepID=UPI004033968D
MSVFPAAFDPAPTLVGERVRLRPLTPDDRQALFAVASDPLIWEQHPAHDRWKPEVFDAFFDEALAEGGGLVVEDPATGAVIGSSRYSTRRAGPGEIEMGWTFLARAFWGGGRNPELKRLMLAHAFAVFDAAIFRVGAENHRSRTALERIGAELTDRRDVAVIDGRRMEHVVYRIGRCDFEARISPSEPAATS